jgi:hypothetical protein
MRSLSAFSGGLLDFNLTAFAATPSAGAWFEQPIAQRENNKGRSEPPLFHCR